MREDLAIQAEIAETIKNNRDYLETLALEVAEKETAYTQAGGAAEELPRGDDGDASTGMEHLNTKLLGLLYPDDRRMAEVLNLLQSSQPVTVNLTQRPEVSDHDFIEEQEKYLYAVSTRTMALPVARGMATLRTSPWACTEPARVARTCVWARGGAPHAELSPQALCWPSFHSGVATALCLVPLVPTSIDTAFVLYNKPRGTAEMSSEHAGFLMGLGLNGHLRDMPFMNIYEYLVKCNEMISIGLLLGLAATYRGTMDVQATKMLSIHLEPLLPPTSVELDIQQNILVAALMGVGLLYQGTAHAHYTQVLLNEIGKPPGPEAESCVEREGYALAAGLALGLVCAGAWRDVPRRVPHALRTYMLGGDRPAAHGQCTLPLYYTPTATAWSARATRWRPGWRWGWCARARGGTCRAACRTRCAPTCWAATGPPRTVSAPSLSTILLLRLRGARGLRAGGRAGAGAGVRGRVAGRAAPRAARAAHLHAGRRPARRARSVHPPSLLYSYCDCVEREGYALAAGLALGLVCAGAWRDVPRRVPHALRTYMLGGDRPAAHGQCTLPLYYTPTATAWSARATRWRPGWRWGWCARARGGTCRAACRTRCAPTCWAATGPPRTVSAPSLSTILLLRLRGARGLRAGGRAGAGAGVRGRVAGRAAPRAARAAHLHAGRRPARRARSVHPPSLLYSYCDCVEREGYALAAGLALGLVCAGAWRDVPRRVPHALRTYMLGGDRPAAHGQCTLPLYYTPTATAWSARATRWRPGWRWGWCARARGGTCRAACRTRCAPTCWAATGPPRTVSAPSLSTILLLRLRGARGLRAGGRAGAGAGVRGRVAGRAAPRAARAAHLHAGRRPARRARSVHPPSLLYSYCDCVEREGYALAAGLALGLVCAGAWRDVPRRVPHALRTYMLGGDRPAAHGQCTLPLYYTPTATAWSARATRWRPGWRWGWCARARGGTCRAACRTRCAPTCWAATGPPRTVSAPSLSTILLLRLRGARGLRAGGRAGAGAGVRGRVAGRAAPRAARAAHLHAGRRPARRARSVHPPSLLYSYCDCVEREGYALAAGLALGLVCAGAWRDVPRRVPHALRTYMLGGDRPAAHGQCTLPLYYTPTATAWSARATRWRPGWRWGWCARARGGTCRAACRTRCAPTCWAATGPPRTVSAPSLSTILLLRLRGARGLRAGGRAGAGAGVRGRVAGRAAPRAARAAHLHAGRRPARRARSVHPPSPLYSYCDCVEREGYALAAGLALGLVCAGAWRDVPRRVPHALRTYMLGGDRPAAHGQCTLPLYYTPTATAWSARATRWRPGWRWGWCARARGGMCRAACRTRCAPTCWAATGPPRTVSAPSLSTILLLRLRGARGLRAGGRAGAGAGVRGRVAGCAAPRAARAAHLHAGRRPARRARSVHPPSLLYSYCDCVEREGYALAAGLALGLVCAGAWRDVPRRVPHALRTYMLGGDRPAAHGGQRERCKPGVNLDVTSPGGTVALGLLYLRAGRRAPAAWLQPPDTAYQLDYVRPDLLMLRVIARGLMLWDSIEASEEWIEDQVPETIKPYCFVKPTEDNIDYEAMNQAYCNIVAGAAFALGLRFAGSGDADARDAVLHHARALAALADTALAELAGRSTLEYTLCVCLLAAGMIMAGRGDLSLLRMCRRLRARVPAPGAAAPPLTHGGQMAIHCTIGLLFLGGGRCTLSTTPTAVAALLAAFFPKFPTHSEDNRYHLQALRHLYVLAVEPRLLLPRDIDTGELCYAHIQVIDLQGSVRQMKAPCILPELDKLKEVKIDDPRYWPITFQRDRNWDQLKLFLEYTWCVEVKQRAGCLPHRHDPHGFLTMLAQSLTLDKANTWSIITQNIELFTNDDKIRSFAKRYLWAEAARGCGECGECGECVPAQRRRRGGRGEPRLWRPCECRRYSKDEQDYVQALNMVTYECVVKDILCALPIWTTFLKIIKTMKTDPSAYHTWQMKLLLSQVEQLDKRSTAEMKVDGLEAHSEPLVSAEFTLAIKQKVALAFDAFELRLTPYLRKYVGLPSSRDFNNCEPLLKKALSAFLVYHDIKRGELRGCAGEEGGALVLAGGAGGAEGAARLGALLR
ncbi:uncharacterized protein LOC101739449 [Bombyx mori]